MSWQRAIYLLGLALVEATPATFLLTLAGSNAWFLVLGIVISGAGAHWLIQRWVPVEQQRLGVLVSGLLVTLWAVKGLSGGGYELFSNWDFVLRALVNVGATEFGLLFLAVPSILYSFWRGAHLTDHDSESLSKLFVRIAIGMLIVVGLGSLGMSLDDTRVAPATREVLIFFAAGLLTLALTSAAEVQDTRLRRIDWRGVLTLCGAVALVLTLGLVFASLLSEGVAEVLGSIWAVIVFILSLILFPLFFLLVNVLVWLFSLIHLDQLAQLLQQQNDTNPLQQIEQSDVLKGLPTWLGMLVQVFFVSLPILIIVALILLARRRAHGTTEDNEERESLLSWSALVHDLRDLFGSLRPRNEQPLGLRAVLARMRGDDPVSRIRRSYIRLLLRGEAHERPRVPEQTPREYEPVATAMLPQAASAVQKLTALYEHARYHPSVVTHDDAAAAEQAWDKMNETDHHP